jgi:hypothetical protein
VARIRSVHSGQWTDDKFVACSPLARLLALGLRNEADDNGIFEWNPIKLKMRLLPADNCDIESLLIELVSTNQVVQYESSSKKYGLIRNFKKYQRPKYPTYLYPIPEVVPEGFELNEPDSGTPPGKSVQRESREEKCSEVKRSARRNQKTRGVEIPLPEGFFPTEDQQRWATAMGLSSTQIQIETEKFSDHHRSKGSVFVDWKAAWRTWIRNGLEWKKPNGADKDPMAGAI